MNILILGSGGREHTFAWKIQQSTKCTSLYIAPGNAGTSLVGNNVNIQVHEFDKIAAFCAEKKIDLIVVGPEAPLCDGIVDYLRNNTSTANIPVIGPDKKGAMLEGSKDFSKNFMKKYGIPTAASKTFSVSTLEEGIKYLSEQKLPIVLKADGLAAGKGVIIAETLSEAQATLREMLADKKFGEASSKVVIEEFLSGIELSVFILADGKNYVILPEAKDYKRIGEGDKGLNTGGMGAISPVPFADKEFLKKIDEKIIKPTMNGLSKENIEYTGFIFFGLINVAGEPYVIEYNARMGDPETEAVIPRIENDLVDLLTAAAEKKLNDFKISISKETAATIVMVAGGYPEAYEKGKEIKGLNLHSEALVFHAGTKLSDNQTIVTNGGRVIAVTGKGMNMEDALNKARKTAEVIQWENKYYRKDIGFDLKKYTESIQQ